MSATQHTINDFRIGESVVPVNVKELTLVIVDIDNEDEKIICRLSTEVERLQHEFNPTELEKESYIRPGNIIGYKDAGNDSRVIF